MHVEREAPAAADGKHSEHCHGAQGEFDAYPQTQHLPRKVRVFIDFLAE